MISEIRVDGRLPYQKQKQTPEAIGPHIFFNTRYFACNLRKVLLIIL
jgi:hypothetical protein